MTRSSIPAAAALVALAIILSLARTAAAAPPGAGPDKRFPLFAELTSDNPPTLITYTPSGLDPRNPANQQRLATSALRADLEALRPTFDGLVLYGYHEALTPRLLAVARDLKFRVVLLAVWDIKSTAEIDGVIDLAHLHEHDFVLGVIAGNEGVTFGRYEQGDLAIALHRLRKKLPASVPIGTSEPLAAYRNPVIRSFGDFLAPNIHPVFDRPDFDAGKAAAWAREEALKLCKESEMPVILKETGFPHGGKPAYTEATQEAFWQAYVKPGLLVRPTDSTKSWVYHGVAFEAFDLPWKAQASGLPIEAFWGLYSKDRKAYPAAAVWQMIRSGRDPIK